MRRAAIVMMGLYALFVTALAFAFPLLDGGSKLARFRELISDGNYLAWLALVLLSEAALLMLPVRVASRRPVSRRSLLWPVAAAGLLMAGLAAGCFLAVDAYLTSGRTGSFTGVCVGMFLVWGGWTVIFSRMAAGKPPASIVLQQCRLLLGGSILELLVAVPTHVAVRARQECCAGIATSIAIVFGVSVMMVSFGPGVLFLYAERWARLRRVDRECVSRVGNDLTGASLDKQPGDP